MVAGYFVSSRRRHTRSKRDWSSDVCSSDLAGSAHTVEPGATVARVERGKVASAPSSPMIRSEERRVGKRVVLGGGRVRVKISTQRSERSGGLQRLTEGDMVTPASSAGSVLC